MCLGSGREGEERGRGKEKVGWKERGRGNRKKRRRREKRQGEGHIATRVGKASIGVIFRAQGRL